MAFVYGPVPSGRLGRSLGVDPLPFKTCNYNCVYCQLGRTTPLTNRRADFYPPEAILAAVRAALESPRCVNLDYVTIVGQGEPLLYASLDLVIAGIKASTNVPVAVITNGSLLHDPELRDTLLSADLVMPSLDAADSGTFRKLNRPWPSLRIGRIVEGMVAFRAAFSGLLWLEVMLVRGLNDSEQALRAIEAAIARIGADRVHLNVPTRPPAERWVEPPDSEGMMRAMAILGQHATIVTPAEGDIDLPPDGSLVDAVVQVASRHPVTETNLRAALQRVSRSSTELQQTLAALEACGELQARVYCGQTFWQYVGARRGSGAERCST
jgi:wyosine [tRNA(Phe)-imidazoG37] synthetase (radical SAM superfamily)